MNAPAAAQALALPPSTETFGLPATDAHLIGKLRRLDPALLTSVLTPHNPVEVTGNIIVHHPTQQQGDKK